MASATPRFWSTPIRYCRWASHEKPALFWSIIIGSAGPVMMLTIPPIQRRYGYYGPERIPMTYPLPQGPRKIPEGYDDPE